MTLPRTSSDACHSAGGMSRMHCIPSRSTKWSTLASWSRTTKLMWLTCWHSIRVATSSPFAETDSSSLEGRALLDHAANFGVRAMQPLSEHVCGVLPEPMADVLDRTGGDVEAIRRPRVVVRTDVDLREHDRHPAAPELRVAPDVLGALHDARGDPRVLELARRGMRGA